MKLLLQRADDFWADLTRQVDWYRDEASPEVAERLGIPLGTVKTNILKAKEKMRAKLASYASDYGQGAAA